MTATLAEAIGVKQIVVCCGSGGVGKTTTAAAIALHRARQGARACVVTIDPAKRLADALGLAALTNAPGRIEGPWDGELWALMLDTKGTFDDLVRRYAPSPAQAESILGNRLYRNISGALSGTQEYMAMEKLYELHHEGAGGAGSGGGALSRFDVIVVDTPPTRNALDFLDAPRRLTSFLDNRIFRLLVLPTRAYLKAVSAATQTLLRTISRVVGSEVVGDAVTFFRAFEGMEAGFRDRADAVLQLLTDERTGFVVVTSPRHDAVEEAAYFAARLEEGGIDVDALVVNRVHPRFGAPGMTERLLGRMPADGETGAFIDNLAAFDRVAAREEVGVGELVGRVAPVVSRVPLLVDDVHDLEGLAAVEAALFG